MSPIDRRSFLEVSFCWLAGVGLLAVITCDGRREEHVLTLESQFQDPGSLAAVGRRYLESSHEELPALLEELRLERGWEAVDEDIRRQYRSGETVLVDGWPLAPTEARLYALFALRAAER